MKPSPFGLSGRILPMLRAVGRAARAAWLAVGLVLVLVLALEGGYRAQAAIRAAIRHGGAESAPLNPAVSEPWYRQLMEEEAAATYAWRPFVYYRRRPFRGTYVNVDSLGRRVTVQAIPPGAARREVFLFGGSPMWGEGLPDSMTIASCLAREVVARGVRDVAFVNFGEAGYVFTQGLMELLLRLRAGDRPAVVVFYGGYNEIQAAMENGDLGGTKVEKDAARDFRLVGSLFTWRTDAGTEARVAARIAGIGAGRFQLLQRFHAAAPTPESREGPAAADVAQNYLATVQIVEALAGEYGFKALYAWMPILDSTKLHESALERAVLRDERRNPFMSTFLDLHASVLAEVKPEIERAVPGRFADLSAVFSGDTTTVFLDDQAHTTAAGSAAVAAALASHIVPLLARASGRPGARSARRP